jgi:hypothetical protein
VSTQFLHILSFAIWRILICYSFSGQKWRCELKDGIWRKGRRYSLFPCLPSGGCLGSRKKCPSRSGDICSWMESWMVQQVNFLGLCGIDTLSLRWFILIVYGYSCPMWRKLKYWFKLVVMVVIKLTFCWAREQWYEHGSLVAYRMKKAVLPEWIMHTHWEVLQKTGAQAQEFKRFLKTQIFRLTWNA